MEDIYYKIELFSDWHTGSGLASGADVDLLVIKDKYSLPFIPGKTLKGLLKDAALDLLDAEVISEDFIEHVFGKDAEGTKEKRGSIKGNAYFSNAEMTKALKEKLKHKTQYLYRKISLTAIEKDGQAKEHSLRRVQTTIPFVLFAKIEGITDDSYKTSLEKCMKMVKRLGTWRNRGFGRCELSIVTGGK